ncbi:MAG: hypothetical protein ACM3US_03725 [Sphingomonadaceae bacterium]
MAVEMTALDKSAQNKRLTTIAWVVFFAMWGLTALAERSMQVDLRSYQYIGAGLTLLGLNGARYLRDIPMSRLTLGMGVLAVVSGAVRQIVGEVSVVAMVGITLLSFLLAEAALRLQATEPAAPEPRRQTPQTIRKRPRHRNG